jgi:hypothetical protein
MPCGNSNAIAWIEVRQAPLDAISEARSGRANSESSEVMFDDAPVASLPEHLARRCLGPRETSRMSSRLSSRTVAATAEID